MPKHDEVKSNVSRFDLSINYSITITQDDLVMIIRIEGEDGGSMELKLDSGAYHRMATLEPDRAVESIKRRVEQLLMKYHEARLGYDVMDISLDIFKRLGALEDVCCGTTDRKQRGLI